MDSPNKIHTSIVNYEVVFCIDGFDNGTNGGSVSRSVFDCVPNLITLQGPKAHQTA